MISPPPNQCQIDTDQDGIIDPAWKAFFTDCYQGILATQSSGTTAKRPTTNLFPGRFYFDTTLGKPIWYKTTSWVLADGTPA